MRTGRLALAGLALAGAFSAGLLFGGRRAGPPPAFQGYEIREGRQGYLNPLLECEVEAPGEDLVTGLAAGHLDEVIEGLERDPQVERLAVYYRDLDEGTWVGHHEQDGFLPASLAKVPILIACLRRAERDPGFLSRTIVYQGLDEEREPGFMNPEVNLERGKAYTVEQLIRHMTEYSDNAAARLLKAAVAPDALATVYADLGLPVGSPTSSEGRLSPRQYGALFRVLYNASYLNRELSTLALDLLARSTFELGLVAGVPPSVVVSHKYGVWESPGAAVPFQLHDCGIVYHFTRPYLLCVMSSGGNYVRMSAAIAAVSRFVYREVDRTAQRAAAPPR